MNVEQVEVITEDGVELRDIDYRTMPHYIDGMEIPEWHKLQPVPKLRHGEQLLRTLDGKCLVVKL